MRRLGHDRRMLDTALAWLKQIVHHQNEVLGDYDDLYFGVKRVVAMLEDDKAGRDEE